MSTQSIQHYEKILSELNSSTEIDSFILALSTEQYRIDLTVYPVQGTSRPLSIGAVQNPDDSRTFAFRCSDRYLAGVTGLVLDIFSGMGTSEIQEMNLGKLKSITKYFNKDTQRNIQCIINHIHTIT